MGKRRKLHDGYYTVRDAHGNLDSITFYSHPRGYKEMTGKHPKVDEDKVIQFEDMCEAFKRNFIEGGWLRLHTPLGAYQEELGTNFLYIPPEHRARIARTLEGGKTLVMEHPFEKLLQPPHGEPFPLKNRPLVDLIHGSFILCENKRHIAVADLLCGEEIVDIRTITNQNVDNYNRGAVTQEEFERRRNTISGWVETKFQIQHAEIEGMFVEG
jgi:hypothetical protein